MKAWLTLSVIAFVQAALGADRPAFAPGQALVAYDHGLMPAMRQPGKWLAVGTVLRTYPRYDIALVRLPPGVCVARAVEVAKAKPYVRFAEPNYYRQAADDPNDPSYGQEWHLSRIEWPRYYKPTAPSAKKIAVLDTGVNYNHPDLSAVYAGGYDYVNLDADPMDDNGHGTHVAGIAVAATNNGLGIAGVAPDGQFLAVKVLDANKQGLLSNILDGIGYAVANGAYAINMSYSSPNFSLAEQNAIDDAVNNGVVCVAAAGNESASTPQYPAAYPNCISVTATTSVDTLASFANYGSTVDVAAPGVGIYSTLGAGYGALSGTSMAAPQVAGAAAWLYGILGASARAKVAADKVSGAIRERAEMVVPGLAAGRLNVFWSALAVGNLDPTWTAHATYAPSYSTWANSVAVDGQGNAFVAGGSSTSGLGIGYLSKYDPNGSQLWSQYVMVESPPTIVEADLLVVDQAGDVYMAGHAAVGKAGLYVGKISGATGQFIWNWHMPISTIGRAVGLALTTTEDHFVLLWTDAWTYSFVELISAQDGAVVWMQSPPMYGTALAVTEDSIYVGGLQGVYPSLCKINFASAILWLQTDNIAFDQWTKLRVEVATPNRIVVGGSLASPALASALCYDASGAFVWRQTVASESGGPGVPVSNGAGSLYLCGTRPGGDTYAVRLDPETGQVDWTSKWSLPDPSDTSFAAAVVDGEGTLAVTGSVRSNDLNRFLTVSWDATGAFLWKCEYYAGIPDQGPLVEATPAALTVGPDGQIYVAGQAFVDTAGDLALHRLDPSGGGNTSTGNVGGTVDLDGYLGSGGLTGDLEFREPGTTTVLVTKSVTLAPGGGYSVTDVPQGRYDVSLKVANWLRRTIPDVGVVNGSIAQDFSLTNGDADGDNAVTLYDLNIVLLSFLTDGSGGGDLDWDGVVGLYDLNKVLLNFLTSGDS